MDEQQNAQGDVDEDVQADVDELQDVQDVNEQEDEVIPSEASTEPEVLIQLLT